MGTGLAAVQGDAVDARMVALMRCALALSALLILGIDPTRPVDLDGAIYVALLAYFLYSAALCIAIFRGRLPVAPRAQPWIDVGSYALLAALTEGATHNIFFHFFFFAILVASFSRGFREGFAVAIAAAAVSVAICLALEPETAPEDDFEDLLIRPTYLLVLGYMIAYWGGHELASRRRLRLLNDLSPLANPRLGVDHAVTQSLRRLVGFFDADACVLVCARGKPQRHVVYRVSALFRGSAAAPLALNAESSRELLPLPEEVSVTWRAGGSRMPDERCERLANLLEASCFASVPYRAGTGPSGRLYLVFNGGACLDRRGLEFLRQATAHIAASIENLILVDTVMDAAAQLERTRISRDIHDTTIQPYIGLKLGLEALQRKVEPDSPVERQVRELVAAAVLAIDDLRGYVARLRGEGARWPGEHLLAGLRDQIGRYRSFYGIDVELRADASVPLNDRIATEAYQIVCEGLSNVYKHTKSKSAFVELRCDGKHLAIEVGNECAQEGACRRFTPRSITARVLALGGRTEVRLGQAGHDIVSVAIPL